MRTLWIFALFILAANTTWAVINPDADGIGVYFDPGANSNCLDLPSG